MSRILGAVQFLIFREASDVIYKHTSDYTTSLDTDELFTDLEGK